MAWLRDYTGSAAPSVSYTYDAEQHITAINDGTGSSGYTYDPFGELVSVTDGSGRTVTYTYDADGDTTGITYPLPSSATWASSDTVAYGYDDDDVLHFVTDFSGKQIAFTDNSDGEPSEESLGTTGDSLNYSYDQSDEAQSISLTDGTSTLQSFSYADGPDGQILTETDTPTSGQSPAGYAYDGQGRITAMTPGSGGTLNYGYDASGNLTTLPGGAAGTYNSASELTAASLNGTTTSYSYDADGNRTSAQQGSGTTASSTWNGVDELTSYTDSAAGMSGDSYDANGLRASDTVTPVGGPATQEQFIWDTSSDKLLMDSANAYIYGTSTAPQEQVNLATGSVTYLVTDALGSVRGAVNSSGSLIATTSYDAWGNPQPEGGLTNYTPFGYAGGYTDPTGLIYFIHRYYDPSTGQFISVDPDVADTCQPYAYAGGDPVNAADPLGEWTVYGACADCGASEAEWGDLMFAVLSTLASVSGIATVSEFTQMRTPFMSDTRIPDVYWRNKNNNFGWISEFKVGYVTMSTGQVWKELADDWDMLYARRALALNGPFKGQKVPINWDIWWFFPNPAGVMKVSGPLQANLAKDGIDSIQIEDILATARTPAAVQEAEGSGSGGTGEWRAG
jgi:RHS repeat-associated protein